MMVLLALPYLIQLALIYHAIKNGKNMTWIWLLIMLPYVGAALYLVMEVLPDLRRGRLIDTEAMVKLVDKEVRVRKLKDRIKISDTPANHLELADEYLALGAYDRAVETYRSQLVGYYQNDRGILLKCARCYVLLEQWELVFEFLTRAQQEGPLTATQQQVHLAYARYRHQPSADNLHPLEELFQATKDLEAGYYFALALHQEHRLKELEPVLEILRIQAKGTHRHLQAQARRYIQQIEALLNPPGQ